MKTRSTWTPHPKVEVFAVLVDSVSTVTAVTTQITSVLTVVDIHMNRVVLHWVNHLVDSIVTMQFACCAISRRRRTKGSGQSGKKENTRLGQGRKKGEAEEDHTLYSGHSSVREETKIYMIKDERRLCQESM